MPFLWAVGIYVIGHWVHSSPGLALSCFPISVPYDHHNYHPNNDISIYFYEWKQTGAKLNPISYWQSQIIPTLDMHLSNWTEAVQVGISCVILRLKSLLFLYVFGS